ncbi:unnamed protein product [Linum trigynum]|uniref:Uncharacterized protein n=1 Tax=Linum trigynum TaxID=586398 RepID=A0AAV2G4I0_9ROSI
MDSCSWTLIGTSPSSNWPPMVLKIKLGHLETLVRRFLSLGIALSLSKLQSPSVWLKICLKGHQWPKHGRGHGRALPQPARALARVNYTASALGETRACLMMDTAVLVVATAVLCLSPAHVFSECLPNSNLLSAVKARPQNTTVFCFRCARVLAPARRNDFRIPRNSCLAFPLTHGT